MKGLSLITALLLSYLSFGQSLQIEYPYQPDADQDELVGTTDLLELLTLFGAEWEASEILVDSVPLSEWILTLATTVVEQGMLIDSLLQINGLAADAEDHCNGATSITYHGKEYAIGSIGNRCWFLENLDSPFDRNGLPIGDGSLFATDYYIHSGSVPGLESMVESFGTTGYYGISAIATDLICPTDWHVSRTSDFFDLAMAAESMPGAHLASTDWQGTGKLPFNGLPYGILQYVGTPTQEMAASEFAAIDAEIQIAVSFCEGLMSESDYMSGTPILQAYFDENEYDSIEEACFVANSFSLLGAPTEMLYQVFDNAGQYFWNDLEELTNFEGCAALDALAGTEAFSAIEAYLEIFGNTYDSDSCYAWTYWEAIWEMNQASLDSMIDAYADVTYPFHPDGSGWWMENHPGCIPDYEPEWPDWSLPYIPEFNPAWYCTEDGNNGPQGIWNINDVLRSQTSQYYDSRGHGWVGISNATISIEASNEAIWHARIDDNEEELEPIWIKPHNTELHSISTFSAQYHPYDRAYHNWPKAPYFSTVRCVKD